MNNRRTWLRFNIGDPLTVVEMRTLIQEVENAIPYLQSINATALVFEATNNLMALQGFVKAKSEDTNPNGDCPFTKDKHWKQFDPRGTGGGV